MAGYYSLEDAAPPGAAPASAAPAGALKDYYGVEDAAPPGTAPTAQEPSPASTAGYIATRTAGGLLRAGQGMGMGDMMMGAAMTGRPEVIDAVSNLPDPAKSLNHMIYGREEVSPPNNFARYAGAVGEAAASNPVMTAAAPEATVMGAVGSEGASDLNKKFGGVLPDWLVRLAGGFAGGFTGAYIPAKLRATFASRAAAPDVGGDANAAMSKNLANAQKFEATPLGKFQETAGNTAAAVGDEASPRTIGQNLITKATDWLAQRKQAHNDAYDALRARMPDPAVTSASHTYALNIPQGPKPPALIDEFMARMNREGTARPDFAELQRWRTRAAELIDSTDASQSKTMLGEFRDALKKDMEATARAHGGQSLVDEWKALDAGYKGDKQAVRRAFGALPDETTTPEDAFAQLAANPSQNLTKIKTLLDKGVIHEGDVRNIASNQFYKLNANPDGVADPTTFARNIIRMRQDAPETVDFLFRRDAATNGPQAQAFDEFMKRATALHLGSGRATQSQAQQAKSALMEFAKRTGRAAAIGSVGKMIPGVGTAAELAGTLAGLGEGAPSGVAPLLQAPRASFFSTPGGQAWLRAAVTMPSLQRPSEQQQ